MNLLVTGATGFLGKKLAFRLQKLGHTVYGFGRNEQIGKELTQNGMTFVKGDLAHEETVVKACENMDYVFHCGAFSSPWGPYETFYAANVLGTKHVIQGCQTHGVKRLIHVSTPSVYFHFDERLDVKEDEPLPNTFVNHYAKTKYLAEQEIDQAFRDGLPVITIRPRALFGPEDNAILPRLIKVNEEKFIPFVNNGNVLMDITYVENVVDALLLCMTSGEETLGQKYNITNGEQIPLHALLKEAFAVLEMPMKTKKLPYACLMPLAALLEWVALRFQEGKEPMLTKYTVSLLSKSQTLNIEKAKKELGYEPKVSVKEGITYYGQWFKEVHR